MKLTMLRILLVGIGGLALCTTLVQAQSDKADRSKTEVAKKVTVTGCLQKGDEEGEYSITGTDGKKYGLRSTTVKLADHLNHKVTITGQTAGEENEKEEHVAEGRDLNVTSLKMVSTSCP